MARSPRIGYAQDALTSVSARSSNTTTVRRTEAASTSAPLAGARSWCMGCAALACAGPDKVSTGAPRKKLSQCAGHFIVKPSHQRIQALERPRVSWCHRDAQAMALWLLWVCYSVG